SPLNHCVLLDNPKIIERLGLLSQPLYYFRASLLSFKEFLGGNKRKTEVEEIIFLPSLFFVLEWLF
ncbi:hypothetical protein, partial [Streptococcus parasanguinis]|uniref:hypothetical protein n=1 Tax=Streptococcus parasanguinis TaxID=1318 RepID=UPI00321976B9